MLVSAEPDGGRRWPWIVAAIIVAVVVVAAVASQLLLPGIAERRIKGKLRDAGVPAQVQVESVPAIKLLLGRIDSANVDARSARTTQDQVGDLIRQTRDIDQLTVAAPTLTLSGLRVTDARLRKRGSSLVAEGTTDRASIARLLPPGTRFGRIETSGSGIELEASLVALGTRLSGPAQIVPVDGALVLKTPPLPVVGSTAISAFDDPQVKLDSVSVRESGPRLRLGARGFLAQTESSPTD